jgi:hypothetical protein
MDEHLGGDARLIEDIQQDYTRYLRRHERDLSETWARSEETIIRVGMYFREMRNRKKAETPDLQTEINRSKRNLNGSYLRSRVRGCEGCLEVGCHDRRVGPGMRRPNVRRARRGDKQAFRRSYHVMGEAGKIAFLTETGALTGRPFPSFSVQSLLPMASVRHAASIRKKACFVSSSSALSAKKAQSAALSRQVSTKLMPARWRRMWYFDRALLR